MICYHVTLSVYTHWLSSEICRFPADRSSATENFTTELLQENFSPNFSSIVGTPHPNRRTNTVHSFAITLELFLLVAFSVISVLHVGKCCIIAIVFAMMRFTSQIHKPNSQTSLRFQSQKRSFGHYLS